MGDSHLPKETKHNIHQKLCFVDTKVFMFKIYNPVEETQITDTSIIVTTPSRYMFWLVDIRYWQVKVTHMWGWWGTLHNFFLAFIDELEKQIIIKTPVEVGQKKNQNNFNIYNVAFFFKKKKKRKR